MIIAGWILAILGLAQIVYSGTIDVSQLVEGNRLLGLAASVGANPDLVAQRSMIHQAGCATFLAGAVFLAAAYLKPAPPGAQSKSWTTIGALAAGSLSLVGAIGFGAFLYFLDQHNADQRLAQAARLKNARAEAAERMWTEADRLAAKPAPGLPPSSTGPNAEE